MAMVNTASASPGGRSVPQCIVFGDEERAPYHPLSAIRAELASIIAPVCSAAFTTDYRAIEGLEPGRHDCVISYTDCWNHPPTDAETAGLVHYVAQGGNLLVIHNGISLQSRPELAQLIGARFTGHPPMTELTLNPVSGMEKTGSFITPSFSIEEEPYRFEIDPLAQVSMIATYSQDGSDHPAAWFRTFGRGRVVYFMPGHWVESFRHPAYRKLILTTMLSLIENRPGYRRGRDLPGK